MSNQVLFNNAQEIIQSLPSDLRNKISDGYHTFAELYDHRVELFITLARVVVEEILLDDQCVWRSRLHSDGTSFEGWFVLGLGYASGEQITYHLPESRWKDCEFATELEKAPEFDGHNSNDVLERLKNFRNI